MLVIVKLLVCINFSSFDEIKHMKPTHCMVCKWERVQMHRNKSGGRRRKKKLGASCHHRRSFKILTMDEFNIRGIIDNMIDTTHTHSQRRHEINFSAFLLFPSRCLSNSCSFDAVSLDLAYLAASSLSLYPLNQFDFNSYQIPRSMLLL